MSTGKATELPRPTEPRQVHNGFIYNNLRSRAVLYTFLCYHKAWPRSNHGNSGGRLFFYHPHVWILPFLSGIVLETHFLQMYSKNTPDGRQPGRPQVEYEADNVSEMKLGRFVMQTKVIKRKGRWKKFLPVYLMMLPGLLYLFINNYMPMAGLVVAFKQVNFSTGIWKSPWVGLKNFEFLFTTDEAAVITRNTILYNLAFIVIGIVLGIFLAILITEVADKTLKKLYQSAILVPFLMSIVIVSYIVYAFLGAEHGLVNNSILPPLGKEPVSWYTQPKYWPFILVFVHTWKGIGYGCLIYISTINGIDKSLYEAASLDGAGLWKKIRHVTLPCLKGTVITLTLLNIGKIFYADFGLFYQVPMNSGQLYDTTNVIDTYVYRALLQLGNSGMAAAAGFYQSVVGFILVMISNLIVRKTSAENALF